MIRATCWALTLALGLWVSWHYAFATWSTESDAAVPFVLWEGVHQYGWAFLADYRHAPDNWLTWPLPLLFAAFATVGTAPPVAFAIGWLLFVASTATAFALVRRAANTPAALACAAILLLSNRAAIGELGFLTYPDSHNGPLLLGLIATLSAVAWLEHARWRSLATVAATLTTAGLADPWTTAAFTLPLACASAVLTLARPPQRRPAALLVATTIAVVTLTQSRLLGALPFLPHPPLVFATADARALSLAWLARLAAMWFNAVPTWQHGYAWIPTDTQTATTLTLLAVAAAATILLATRQAGRSPAFDLLWLTGLASSGAVCAAFVLLDFPPVISVGRFFMAAYVFAIILATATAGRAWPTLRPSSRALVTAAAIALPASGLASAPQAWLTRSLGVADDNLRTYGDLVPPFDNGIHRFTVFLQAHRLRFGYGAYWADEANAVAWASDSAIQLRPIAFDPATGEAVPFFAQISRRWFTGPDGPLDDATTFLTITPGFLACADVALCTRAAGRRFGPPRESLVFEAKTILVWDHRLFGENGFQPGKPLIEPVEPVEPAEPVTPPANSSGSR